MYVLNGLLVATLRVKELLHHMMVLNSLSMASITNALMVVAIALVVIYVSKLLKQHKLKLPPGPTPLPIIGSFHLLGKYPHKSMTELAQKYGPLMSLQLGQRLCVVATSPEAAKEILKFQDAIFSARPPLRATEFILPKDLVISNVTPVSRYLKKIFVSELTSAKRLEASKHIREEEMAFMLRRIAEETGPVQVKTYLNIMSTNIISRMVLSKRFLGAAGDQNLSDIHNFMEILNELNFCFNAIHPQDVFNFIPKWFDPQGLDGRFRKLGARMDMFYMNMVNQHKDERRKNPILEGEKTMLDVLLEQIDNSEHKVTEEHVKGVIWDSFAGGTETTTVTVEWAMAEILRDSSLVKKARLEIDHVVGLNRIVEESDIPQLKYIQAIVKETLRLHATFPLLIPHQNNIATKVLGYDIPANTRMFVNAGAIGRDPGSWENPLEFVPERFLDGAQYGSVQFQGQNFEFIPFGSGRRSCPGMTFASIVMHLKVANLLHAFDWSLPDGVTPAKLDMNDGAGVVVGKRDPLVAVAKPRLPSYLYQ